MSMMRIMSELIPLYRDGLDCDGQSRLFGWKLRQLNILHTIHQGYVIVNGEFFPVHYWIEFDEHPGYVLDMKLSKWFPEHANVPHGLFLKAGYSHIEYTYIGVDNVYIGDAIASVLMTVHGGE